MFINNHAHLIVVILLLLTIFLVPLKYLIKGNDVGIEFDVPVNAVHLIFRQLLVLVSVPVFPMAPVLALLMSLVLTNCSAALVLGILPATRRPLPFGAGPVFYKRVMLLALVFAIVPVAYFAGSRTPGPCGPYRGQPHIFHIVTDVVHTLPTWLQEICYFVASVCFLVLKGGFCSLSRSANGDLTIRFSVFVE